MNKITLLAIVLISTLLGCNAQQSQNRSVSEFTKIHASGAVTVYYTNSDTLSLIVKAKSSELDKIETKVENGTLVISSKGNFTGPVLVYVKNNKLNDIQTTGATDFKCENIVKTDKMNVNATGASNVNLKIEAHIITSSQSGASNVTMKGETDSLTSEVTGASALKAYGLSSKNVKVTATGASTAKVLVTETIKANATGASDIKIKGDPKEVAAEASTAASISRVENTDSSKNSTDTTTYNWKNKKFMVISDPEEEKEKEVKHDNSGFKHWRGFAMGVNGYFNDGGGIEMKKPLQFMDVNYARSFNFQFNIIERHFNLIQNYLTVVTGFGFDYHLYEFANRTDLNPDSAFTWGTINNETGSSYIKNKLRATYLQVPLLIEFNTSDNSDKAFHMAAGVVGQYLISSRTKQVIEEGGYEYTRVKKDSYNLNPFGAKAHVNLGYKGWMVFGEYSLTTLFQPGKGPELYPFTAGIRLVPFG